MTENPATTSQHQELDKGTCNIEAVLRDGFSLLRFPRNLESDFHAYYHDKTLKRVRIALLTGIFLYALFSIDDLLVLPKLHYRMWLVRFAIVCPLGLLAFFFTYTTYFRRLMQPTIWVAMQVGGLGIIFMTLLDPQKVGNPYNTGLMLVVMYTFTLVGLRFWYSIFWAITILAAYLTIAFISPVTTPVRLHNIFNIMATISIGAISNYLMEKYIRRDFLQSLLVEEEKRQLLETGMKLQELSVIDEVTGIANRRHFEQFLEQEWQRALRDGFALSVIMFDIDYFKNYNDTYGHQTGDECLKKVAGEIAKCARRPGDLASRYGGEEFAVILSNSDASHAAAIADICRLRIQQLRIPHTKSIGEVVTISAGVASMIPVDIHSKRLLVELADQALYKGKKAGRNCVMIEPDAYASRNKGNEIDM